MSVRRRFFRTRPTPVVTALLALGVFAIVLGFRIHGTPVTFVHVKGLRHTLPVQHTRAVDYLKLALKIGGIGLVLVAGILHTDRLTTPESLADDEPTTLDPAAPGKVGTPNQTVNTRI
jgi:hypothetical protein